MSQLIVNPSTAGWAGRQGVDEAFGTIRGSNGTIHRDEDDGTNEAISLRCSSTVNQFDLFRRGMFAFDTSSLPDSAIISAVILELYVNAKTTTLGSQALTVCNGGPASATELANSDFEGNLSNTTAWSNANNLSDISTSAYNTWTLNATGIAGISKTGTTKFQMRFESDRANSAPSWGSGNTASMNFDFLNGSNPPKLTITYTVPVFGNPIFFT